MKQRADLCHHHTQHPSDARVHINCDMRPSVIKQRDVAPVQTFAKAAAKCSAEVGCFGHVCDRVGRLVQSSSGKCDPLTNIVLCLTLLIYMSATGTALRPVRHCQLRKH